MDEKDGGKGKGKPSRDFLLLAKVYREENGCVQDGYLYYKEGNYLANTIV
jgi:hypothetical protein